MIECFLEFSSVWYNAKILYQGLQKIEAFMDEKLGDHGISNEEWRHFQKIDPIILLHVYGVFFLL